MKPLQAEKSEIGKKMGQAQWDVQAKEKEIEKLLKEIIDQKELIEFYNNSLHPKKEKTPEYKAVHDEILEDLLGHRGLSYKEMIDYLISLENKWRSKLDEL